MTYDGASIFDAEIEKYMYLYDDSYDVSHTLYEEPDVNVFDKWSKKSKLVYKCHTRVRGS